MAAEITAAQAHHTEAKPSIVSWAMTATATRFATPKMTIRRSLDSERGATRREHVESDEHAAVAEVHAVGEVVGTHRHRHRTAHHRREQHATDDRADDGERGGEKPAPTRRLDRRHGDRHEHRQHDEGDDEVDPQRAAPETVRHVALEAEPDDRLHELVRAEQHRQARQRDMTGAAIDVPDRVDADPADDGTPDEISLGREAHVGNLLP